MLTIRENSLPKDHWIIADARVALGSCLSENGHSDQANLFLTSGVATLESTLGPNNPRTQRARQALLKSRRIGVLSWAGEIPQ